MRSIQVGKPADPGDGERFARGAEPALIDTGMSAPTEEFRAALWNIVDPADLRWIIVTHDDRDHTGSLMAILDEAPNATVVTNFISMVKMSEDFELPIGRLRLINSGEQLDVGDDVFETFRPPARLRQPGHAGLPRAAPQRLLQFGLHGGFLPAIAETAEDLPAAEYHAGVAMFTSAISSWLHDITPGRWQAALDALRERKPDVLLSTHGLPMSSGLGGLLDATASLPTGPALVPPGREFVESMLAMAGHS